MPRTKLSSSREYLARYPRICAHIIAESRGYATPLTAAGILRDAKEKQVNYCEWIYASYRTEPRKAVEGAVRHRATHVGYMASYDLALQIVRHQLETGESPAFGSWF